MSNTAVINNTGSIALEISGFNFKAPLYNITVTGNSASGIRMVTPVPKDCHFVNNIPSAASAKNPTVTLQGGGIFLQAPAKDSLDPPGQHGLLQQLNIVIQDTVIDGNVAAEGGGLWSAWPVQLNNCIIRNNKALAAGGGLYLRGLQADPLGSSGFTVIDTTLIVNNTAGFGGGLAWNSGALRISPSVVAPGTGSWTGSSRVTGSGGWPSNSLAAAGSAAVLSMVRHIRLSTVTDLSYRSLAFVDISSFTSFVAFDCIIPGPQEIHGIVKTVTTAIGLPVALLLAALVMWVVIWGLHHIAARAHRWEAAGVSRAVRPYSDQVTEAEALAA
eukprot:gene9568-9730_t